MLPFLRYAMIYLVLSHPHVNPWSSLSPSDPPRLMPGAVRHKQHRLSSFRKTYFLLGIESPYSHISTHGSYTAVSKLH